MESEFRYAEKEKLPRGEGLHAYNLLFKDKYRDMKQENNVWHQVWETAVELRQKELDRKISGEKDEKVIRSLKKTRNLAKIYAAHQVIRWEEEVQSDMAMSEINPGELHSLAIKQEIAQQDFCNAIKTKLMQGKWPDSEFKDFNRQRAIEFSEKVAEIHQPKEELLFKEQIESIIAVAHLGLVKIQEVSKNLKRKEVKIASSALLMIPVACLGLNLLAGDFDTSTRIEIPIKESGIAVETSGVNPIPTIESAIIQEPMHTVLPTTLPTAKPMETTMPSHTETRINYYEWLNPAISLGGNLDLNLPFILNASEQTASIMGYGNQLKLEANNIDVNRYNNAQQATEAGWGRGFENPLLNIDMDITAVEQGNNGRSVIYCHSGSFAGIEWPCNWVKNAMWYHDQIIGQETSITQENAVYHFRIEALNTVPADEYNEAARVFSDPLRPMMRDIASLTPGNNLENPGIDIVVCGGMINGEGVSIHGYRTIMSADLESVERLGDFQVQGATFGSNEIKDGTLPNIEAATHRVNNYFENRPLVPGEEFSLLNAVDNFSGNEWINGTDFTYGGGTCDIATLLNRSIMAYSSLLGLPYGRLNQVGGNEIWGMHYLK